MIDWIKGIWTAIVAGFNAVTGTVSEGWRVARLVMIKFYGWIVAAVVGVMVVLKSIFDFLVTIFDRLMAQLSSTDISNLQGGVEGQGSSAMSYLAFFNSFLPLDELFVWANFLLAWWGVCHYLSFTLKVGKMIRG